MPTRKLRSERQAWLVIAHKLLTRGALAYGLCNEIAVLQRMGVITYKMSLDMDVRLCEWVTSWRTLHEQDARAMCPRAFESCYLYGRRGELAYARAMGCLWLAFECEEETRNANRNRT